MPVHRWLFYSNSLLYSEFNLRNINYIPVAKFIEHLDFRPDGRPKDTTKNIKDTGEFVVHMVDRPLGQAMVECGVEFSPEVDELNETGLHLVPSSKVKPGRIVGAPVAMECHFEKTIKYVGRSITFGRVVHMQVRDDCIDPETLYVNSDVYQPIARLHSDNYIVSNDQFEIYKPTLEEFRAQQASGSARDNE